MPSPTVGIEALSKLQFARNADSDSDDLIAATEIWRGLGRIEDTRDLHIIEEDVGILVGTDRTNTSLYGAKVNLESTPATFEQLPHLFEMSMKTVTPSADSGDVYTYTYPIPTTAVQALKPYTWQGGDNVQAEAANFVHCLNWQLQGEGGKEWMMSGSLFGKQVVNNAFTALSSLISVNEMNFSQTKLYIDNDSDNWGTTLFSNTLLKATLAYDAKLVGVPTADGNLTWSFVKMTKPEITLKITFEHDTQSVGQKTAWRNETPKLIRLLNQGPAFTVPSSTYTYRSAYIDLAGKWLKFAPLGKLNGNNVYEGTFQVKYNSTKASAGQILMAIARSTLG